MITDRRRKDNGTFGRLLRNTPPESTNSFTPNGSNAIGLGGVSASMDKQELAPRLQAPSDFAVRDGAPRLATARETEARFVFRLYTRIVNTEGPGP